MPGSRTPVPSRSAAYFIWTLAHRHRGCGCGCGATLLPLHASLRVVAAHGCEQREQLLTLALDQAVKGEARHLSQPSIGRGRERAARLAHRQARATPDAGDTAGLRRFRSRRPAIRRVPAVRPKFAQIASLQHSRLTFSVGCCHNTSIVKKLMEISPDEAGKGQHQSDGSE